MKLVYVIFCLLIFSPSLAHSALANPDGLCINNTNCADSNNSNSSAVTPRAVNANNFHPGFYFASNYDSITYFDAYKDKEYFVGIKKLYKWRDLEIAEGVYDFSGIQADLAHAESIHKQLWIAISVTEYNGRVRPKTPPYMWNDPKYGCGPEFYGAYKRSVQNDGWLPCSWNEHVHERLVALYQALGALLNNEPHFEGINIDETSTGKPLDTSLGWSSVKELAAFKATALAVKNAFPDKTVLQMINYASFDVIEFANWLVNNGIGTSGPDVHLGEENKEFLNKVIYPFHFANHNHVPTGIEVQHDNYTRYGQTPEIILGGTIERINPWYMFWHNREANLSKGEDPARFFTHGVIPLLNEYGQHLPAAEKFYRSMQ